MVEKRNKKHFLKISQNGESRDLEEGYIRNSSEGPGRVFTPHVLPRVQQRRGRSSDPKDKGALELPLAEGAQFCLLGPLFSAENQEQVGYNQF